MDWDDCPDCLGTGYLEKTADTPPRQNESAREQQENRAAAGDSSANFQPAIQIMNDQAAVLESIYDAFADWADNSGWACRKGCAHCCSQNVTLSSLEGRQILAYVGQQDNMAWLRQRLNGPLAPHRPNYTINTLARACLAGKELHEATPAKTPPCPFLENDCCAIYPARPFSCRCFLSLHTCSPRRPAVIDAHHLAASTAVSQLIEHLDQRAPWGNMLDVLRLLLTPDDNGSGGHTLRAQPLPGFMLDPDEQHHVDPLLQRIFTSVVGGRTVEDILNGR